MEQGQLAQSRKPDLTKISLREYRSLFSGELETDAADALIARVFGFEDAEKMLDDITQPEYRKMIDDMVRAARDPIENDEKN